jgi:serine/threonine protein phosphatase PrpC
MSLDLEPYTLTSYGLSDTGLLRKNNEDVWGSLPQMHVFVLADGMGGHRAGEVAAREAVLFFLEKVKELLGREERVSYSVNEVADILGVALGLTNTFIYDLSKTHDLLSGMGTTFVCLCFHDSCVISVHIGDSRIYLRRAKVLEQLTEDHSLFCELSEKGSIQKAALHESSYKSVLTKALGIEPFVEPTIKISSVLIGDLYLLCSDGLSDLLQNSEIDQILGMPLTVEEKVRALIAFSKRKGGFDNITAVLIEVVKAK